ncbi:MAG: efflux RND transporter periplasmic adaptor subunit [Cytophagales bacterium]|nr:efflux RND transporter periplasmic adaptor subunit [Cytophagales bacterium]
MPIAVIVGAAALSACSPKEKSTPPEVIRPVQVMTVGAASVAAAMTYSAEIRPRIESQLAFRVGGKVVERLVELGASVRKNQVLMRLDPADLQLSANAALAQVAAAKAHDDVAQAALKRAQELARQNFISAGALDQAVGQANVTHASLLAAQATSAQGLNATAYGTLRADADGVVTALTAEVGQVVAAGTPVIKVSASGAKDVVFAVPDRVVGRLKSGTQIDVQLWAQSGVTLSAVVRDISAIADPLTRTFVIKATLNDVNHVAPLGATATVVLRDASSSPKAGAESSTIIIPLASVVEAQGKTAVWVVETAANTSVVKKRAITLVPVLPAAGADAQVAVASGLAAGAVIVTAGVHTLTEGQKVRLLSEAAKP